MALICSRSEPSSLDGYDFGLALDTLGHMILGHVSDIKAIDSGWIRLKVSSYTYSRV